MLIDGFGRVHDNLRVSVTDRCNIRCFYCMPDADVKFGPRESILSFEEIERVVRAGTRLGIRKVRVTGGEPLLRRDLDRLLRRLTSIDDIRDVSITTNGVFLAEHARSLYDAGLRRINVHLDTLDRERFFEITRRDVFDKVLDGIHAAERAGLRIKINAVAIKNLTEPDILPLAAFGREHDIEIRYIEFMPLDAQDLWQGARVLTAAEILATLRREFGELHAVPDPDPSAPASEYRYADGRGSIGIIASVTQPFCGNCNRLRLTADGHLRYCLFAVEETDIRPALRGHATDDELERLFVQTVREKWRGHSIGTAQFVAPPRPMYSIGG
jgi:cyclic pyranopterin phosphate synthase